MRWDPHAFAFLMDRRSTDSYRFVCYVGLLVWYFEWWRPRGQGSTPTIGPSFHLIKSIKINDPPFIYFWPKTTLLLLMVMRSFPFSFHSYTFTFFLQSNRKIIFMFMDPFVILFKNTTVLIIHLFLFFSFFSFSFKSFINCFVFSLIKWDFDPPYIYCK